jgi:hypothetical protein
MGFAATESAGTPKPLLDGFSDFVLLGFAEFFEDWFRHRLFCFVTDYSWVMG